MNKQESHHLQMPDTQPAPVESQKHSRRNFLEWLGVGAAYLLTARIASNELIDPLYNWKEKVRKYIEQAHQQGVYALDWGLYPDWHAHGMVPFDQINVYQENLALSDVGIFITFEELKNPARVEELIEKIHWLHRRQLRPQISIGNGRNYLAQPHMFHPDNRALIVEQVTLLADILAQFDEEVLARVWFEMNIAWPYGFEWFGKGWWGVSDEAHARWFHECWQILYEIMRRKAPLVKLVLSPSGLPDYPFKDYIPQDPVTGVFLLDLVGLDIYDMNPHRLEFLNPIYYRGKIPPDRLVYLKLLEIGKIIGDKKIPFGLTEFNTYTGDPRADVLVAAATAAAGGSFITRFDVPKEENHSIFEPIETSWRTAPAQILALRDFEHQLATKRSA